MEGAQNSASTVSSVAFVELGFGVQGLAFRFRV